MTRIPTIDEILNTREPYHPMRVWTWSKEEQQAYQDRIQPLLDAAAEIDPGEQGEFVFYGDTNNNSNE